MKLNKSSYLFIEKGKAHLATDRKLMEEKLNMKSARIASLFEGYDHFLINEIEIFTNITIIPSNRRKIQSRKGFINQPVK